MEAIAELSRRYNVTRVFLATDDAKIISQSAKYADRFDFVHIPADRGLLNSKQQIEYRKSLWDGSSVGAVQA